MLIKFEEMMYEILGEICFVILGILAFAPTIVTYTILMMDIGKFANGVEMITIGWVVSRIIAVIVSYIMFIINKGKMEVLIGK